MMNGRGGTVNNKIKRRDIIFILSIKRKGSKNDPK